MVSELCPPQLKNPNLEVGEMNYSIDAFTIDPNFLG